MVPLESKECQAHTLRTCVQLNSSTPDKQDTDGIISFSFKHMNLLQDIYIGKSAQFASVTLIAKHI